MEVRVGPRQRRVMLGLAVVWLFSVAAGAADTQASSGGPSADNSRCYVCHVNYKKEELASRHERANVGCQKCHGDSSAHCADEDNVTPPDIMYPPEKINAFCITCHPTDKQGKPRQLGPVSTATGKKYCTDCHGSHRLSYRVQHWDKTTGKLIPKEEKR